MRPGWKVGLGRRSAGGARTRWDHRNGDSGGCRDRSTGAVAPSRSRPAWMPGAERECGQRACRRAGWYGLQRERWPAIANSLQPRSRKRRSAWLRRRRARREPPPWAMTPSSVSGRQLSGRSRDDSGLSGQGWAGRGWSRSNATPGPPPRRRAVRDSPLWAEAPSSVSGRRPPRRSRDDSGLSAQSGMMRKLGAGSPVQR